MTSRDISGAYRADLEARESPHVLLYFLEVTHENLITPIRLVTDVHDYVWQGNTWIGGIRFDATEMTDVAGTPYMELRIANIDRRIGQAAENTHLRPEVALYELSSVDFDVTVDPRTEIGTPTILYQAVGFTMVDINADAAELTARVTMWDDTREPWPIARATAAALPGAHR